MKSDKIKILLIDDNKEHFSKIKEIIRDCFEEKGILHSFLMDNEDSSDFIKAFNKTYRNSYAENSNPNELKFFNEKITEWKSCKPDIALIDVNWGMTSGDENGISFVQNYLRKNINIGLKSNQIVYLSIVSKSSLGERYHGVDFISKEIENENGEIVESMGRIFSDNLQTKLLSMHTNINELSQGINDSSDKVPKIKTESNEKIENE